MPPSLTPEEVIDIFLATGAAKAIAYRFGTTQPTVSNIKRRRAYRSITALFEPEMMNGVLASMAFTGRFS